MNQHFMKRVFATLLVVALSILGGCEKADDYTNDKYLASDQLKEITLENTQIYTTSLDSSNAGVVILQDYNYRYNLRIYKGSISLVPYYRRGGAYSNEAYAEEKEFFAGIEDRGVCDNLDNLSVEAPGGSGFNKPGNSMCQYLVSFQPNHGYMATMALENQSKSIVLYAKDYTLDSEGTLLTATLEYKIR